MEDSIRWMHLEPAAMLLREVYLKNRGVYVESPEWLIKQEDCVIQFCDAQRTLYFVADNLYWWGGKVEDPTQYFAWKRLFEELPFA